MSIKTDHSKELHLCLSQSPLVLTVSYLCFSLLYYWNCFKSNCSKD